MHQYCPPPVITGNVGCITIDATAFDGPSSSAADVTCQRPGTYFQARDTRVSDNIEVRPRRRCCSLYVARDYECASASGGGGCGVTPKAAAAAAMDSRTWIHISSEPPDGSAQVAQTIALSSNGLCLGDGCSDQKPSSRTRDTVGG